MTRDEIDLESALFSPRRSTHWVTVREGDEFGVEIPDRLPVSHPVGDSPLMIAALARAAEAGREHRASKFFVDRRLPWLIALEAHLAEQSHDH